LQYIDIASGDLSAEEYLTGENVRDYFENSGASSVRRCRSPTSGGAMHGQDAFGGIPGMENERMRNIFRAAAARTEPLRSHDRLPLPGQEMRQRFFDSPEGQRLNAP